MSDAVKQFLIVFSAGIAAALASQYLINNVRAVRRVVGGL